MMNRDGKPFEAEKSFGLGVLLKLTKKNIPGIEISSNNGKFRSNVTLNQLTNAVNATLKTHNIILKVK